MWDALDNVVLEHLNRGESWFEAQKALFELEGYEGPRPAGAGAAVGNAVFFAPGERGRERPSYELMPLAAVDGEQVLLGVWDNTRIPSGGGDGRLSVFAQRDRRWTRTQHFDSSQALLVHALRTPAQGDLLVVLEHYCGADRDEGTLRLWSVRGGRLERRGRPRPELVDFSVDADGEQVEVTFTRFPRGLDAPVLGTRLHYRLRIRPVGGGVEQELTSLNPWVEAVDRFQLALRDGHPARARGMLAHPRLLWPLAHCGGDLVEEGGDLEGGTGYVVCDGPNHRWRVELARTPQGSWRVDGMRPLPRPP
jgi:hypothetical protein